MKALKIVNKKSGFNFGVVKGNRNVVIHLPYFSVNVKMKFVSLLFRLLLNAALGLSIFGALFLLAKLMTG